MIYVKKQLSDGVTVQTELTDEDYFYTRCVDCGQEIEATNEILDDFADFIFGACYILCEKCTAKRNGSSPTPTTPIKKPLCIVKPRENPKQDSEE